MDQHDDLRVLWLTGPPGAGKSTLAWALYERLAAEGEHVAHVDIDQLGMCFPEPDGDPGRYALKTRALVGVARTLRARGVPLLVVSGVTADGPEPELPGCRLLLVRLTAERELLRRRLVARGDPVSAGSEEHGSADAGVPAPVVGDLVLDTSIAAVPDLVDRLVSAWQPSAVRSVVDRQTGDPSDVGPADGEILWLTGPRCVGTSTVGWDVVSSQWRESRRTGFADLGQLSFLAPDGGFGAHDGGLAALGVEQAAALWRTFAAVGARRMVLVGALPADADLARLASRFGPARLTVVRLEASSSTLRERADRRRAGGPAALAGDDLLGRTPDAAARVAERAIMDLGRAVPDGVARVDTDGVPPSAVASEVLARAGW